MRSDDLDLLIAGDDFRQWQMSLIYERGKFSDQESSNAKEAQDRAAERQQVLEEAVTSGPRAACQYMLRSFLNNPDQEGKARQFVPLLPLRLTVDEMDRLPAYAESRIEQSLTEQGLSPAVAAESHFWALSHAIWMEMGIFGPDLAAVFFRKAKDREGQTRNFLRRTGGLPGVRGNTSVLTDCPLSAAWWRCRMARQVADEAEKEGIEMGFSQAHELLRPPPVWRGIVDYAVQRVTVINAPRAMTAVLVAVDEYQSMTGKNVGNHQVKSSVQHLAQLGYRYNLHHIEWWHMANEAMYGLRNPAEKHKAEEDNDEEEE